MEFSDDAVLQAAATIVAGQISAKTFPAVDMGDVDVMASALSSALTAVQKGVDDFRKNSGRKSFFDTEPCVGHHGASRISTSE